MLHTYEHTLKIFLKYRIEQKDFFKISTLDMLELYQNRKISLLGLIKLIARSILNK